MRIKKNSILITLLFVLSIGLIVMIRNNYQINSELKECNLKLLEKKIALGSAIWAITQCHKYTNERIKDLDLIVDRQKRPFSLELMMDISFSINFLFRIAVAVLNPN